ncbi:membrane dipeptidase-domain-containing protein [Lophiotrema nucula]|uniref:Dipeptidase n=1 Tax=Lophiotrema nucula TaxID=690887 RepID=A0A6A5Z8D7_9PLEO|nr:membrane dipeptidase-domain-containing protein [Lophiotrema nucula]
MSDTQAPVHTSNGDEHRRKASTAVNGSDTHDRALVLHPSSQSNGITSRLRSVFVAASLAIILTPLSLIWPGIQPPLDPSNYSERARRILKSTPLIDGHNDLPWQLRVELHNRLYDSKADLETKLLGHTDLVRLREGMVGGQFWSVYVDCDVNQKHFEDPSWVVRDTLEQIDVTKRFVNEHPRHLMYCQTPSCVRKSFKMGKTASMIGIEGGHQVGGSIASIRQVFNLGARYITMTHNCDNAFGTAASTVAAGNQDVGLFKLGYSAVKEMNRLGMIIDLSHVSHQTMRDILSVARTPVIFSHSGAYSVGKHLRNAPDDVLRSMKQNGGVVMATFVNKFLKPDSPDTASVHDVIDHILHIADLCGWECVGIGSDFSGMPHAPKGLEDVSKFPNLIEALLERGVTDEQIKLLVGENLLRVWGEIEKKAKHFQASGESPVEDEYEGRGWHMGEAGDPWMLRESADTRVPKDAEGLSAVIQGRGSFPAVKNV